MGELGREACGAGMGELGWRVNTSRSPMTGMTRYQTSNQCVLYFCYRSGSSIVLVFCASGACVLCFMIPGLA